MNITHINAKDLHPSPWISTNYILAPDRKLLKDSMERFGHIYPIVVRKEDSSIIDGYHRWLVAQDDEKLSSIPCHVVDCDEVDAMLLHVTLNRARGEISNKALSGLLKRIRRSKKYDDGYLQAILRMTFDEFDALAEGSLIKRKVKEHEYSRAWVPVEASGDGATSIQIERPPNEDG